MRALDILKDKQELLRKFVQNNENLKLVESSLNVSREQSGEATHRRELLTIAEMKTRNFSSYIRLQVSTNFLFDTKTTR